MPIRLIDPNQLHEIDISGSKFWVRPLNGRQKAMLMTALESTRLSENMPESEALTAIIDAFPKIEPIFLEVIEKTDIPNLTPAEIIRRIEDPMDYILLANKIMGLSKLGDTEVKN